MLRWPWGRGRVTDRFGDKLRTLGFTLPPDAEPPSEAGVRDFERRFHLDLPPDLRAFLTRYGGVRGQPAGCELLEPSPVGASAYIEHFYGFGPNGITDMTDLIEGAPDIIALGGEPLGRMFWLICTPPYRGHVFVRDHYGRSSWTDEEFLRWPDLAPEIRPYLDLRRTGRLSKKPAGFEDMYLAARSFTDFVERLNRSTPAAERPTCQP